jgi:hypothetical protein
MNDFVDYLQRDAQFDLSLEDLTQPATFSAISSEFAIKKIAVYSNSLVQNRYHNGFPDLISAGQFRNDSVQHSPDGIEVKSSRYLHGWQGHNPEDTWLLVFCFKPFPFRYTLVAGAPLYQCDWKHAGRSPTSRRTITASVTAEGRQKMVNNYIYRV